ncbi:hypothetical protein LIER_39175 [Lithospermum erythrorhizon]|uniref:Uncharacterized protein n=1 Tax=Lithospermum erythrorhizon TaxID=34254 RepID=A0AAV3QCA4_LITER
MEDRVCKKRASDSSQHINPQDDATCQDPMVPITPHSKSENLMLASFSSGIKLKSNLSVARTLRFDLDTNFVEFSEDVIDFDEIIFESIYSSIMEVIMLNQINENDKGLCHISCSYGFRTPIGPRVSGLGHTCPAAPVKTSKRRRIVDNKICRKLEF